MFATTTILSVFALLQFFFVKSVTASFTNLTLNAPYGTMMYTAACNQYTYFRVVVEDPCVDLNVRVIPSSGAPKVFVSRDKLNGNFGYPTITGQSWSFFRKTTKLNRKDPLKLIIQHWDPDFSPGNFDIGVFGDCSLGQEAAVFQIAVSSFGDDSQDILVNPSLSMNKLVKVNDYVYYRFCIPKCADVTVSLQNCLNFNGECPTTYSYPELLTSRTTLEPQLHDYSWKLASVARRSNYILHNDTTARDNNGYISGTYYVAVYGYCTPTEYVVNNATDGPCIYAANTRFNVTVSYTEFPDVTCHAPVVRPDISNYPIITSGSPVSGSVACDQYTYYQLKVPERCVSVNFLMTTTSDSLYTAAEFAVGKYPNLIPTFDNLQWTSYDSYVQNFTIDAWDPAFDGGNNCGLNHNRVCELYIGVVGYCVNSTLFNTVDFTFNISLTKESGIFRNTVPYQTIAPGQQNSYKMCVDTNASSFVYLSTNRDACGCSTNYTNLQMTVSKTQEKPELTDYVWQLADVFSTHSLPLLSTDDSVRPGSYYVNVYGECNQPSTCTDPCTCGPCSHLQHAQFALHSGPLSETTSPATYNANDACPVKNTPNTCAAVCAQQAVIESSSSPVSSNSNKLSPGAIAGIVIGVLVFVGLMAALAYFVFIRNRLAVPVAKPAVEMDQEMSSAFKNSVQE